MATIIIETTNEAHLQQLIRFAERLKVAFKVEELTEDKPKTFLSALIKETLPDSNDYDDTSGVPLSVALKMVESLKEIDSADRGEIALPTWADMMKELEADKEAVVV